MLKFRQLMTMSGLIVFRLRLAFLCIVLTLVLAGTIGGYQLINLVNSQEKAIERAVPSLVTAHELQSKLARMLELRERLRQADSVTGLTELETGIRHLIRSLLSTVNSTVNDSVTLPSSTLSLTSIDANLTELEQLLLDIVPLQLKLIRGQNRLTQQRQMLLDHKTQLRYRVEPRLIRAALLLDKTLDQPTSLSITDRDSITAQVNIQLSLSELSFRVMAVIDLAEQLSLRTGADFSSEGAVDLQFRLRSVAQTLASLEDDPFRRQMALMVKQLHDLILGTEGLVGELKAYERYKTSLDRLLDNQGAIINSVSQAVDSLVTAAHAEIDVSSQTFGEELYRTLTLLLVAALLITVVTAWVSYQVVGRQIGRRMSRLTSAVLDIADGDTERVVAVRGNDEIGMMANALEVFKDNARKLRETSMEMEQFAYAAAHDLRSPLRAIESLAQWSLEDGDELPQDCVDNLQKILQRTQRLSRLQSELLDYSRAGHMNDNLERVDLASIVNELSDLLDPDGHYSIHTLDPLPTVCTYTTPLRQVLLNLLTNAIKHHDKDRGKIQIGVKTSADRMTVSVKDDGAGIEPRFQAQIFDLFSTLQSKDVVEGSGLGLALIVKLVTRYGGTVQVDSNPDKSRGATFSFDWPAQSVLQHTPAGSTRSGAQLEHEPQIPPSAHCRTENCDHSVPPGLPTDRQNDEQHDVTRRKAS